MTSSICSSISNLFDVNFELHIRRLSILLRRRLTVPDSLVFVVIVAPIRIDTNGKIGQARNRLDQLIRITPWIRIKLRIMLISFSLNFLNICIDFQVILEMIKVLLSKIVLIDLQRFNTIRMTCLLTFGVS